VSEIAVSAPASETSNASLTATLGLPLRTFATLQIFLALVCVFAELYCRYVLHLGNQYIYPLKNRNQTGWDYTLFAEQFRYFHRPEFFVVREFPYPAPVAIPYAIFFSYHAHPLRFFFGFILASFAIAGLLLGLALHRRGVSSLKATLFILASLLMAYPLWFELKQANMEICVWVLVAAGVWAFCRGKGYSAAACFGIAGAMKIFPFVFLGLMLARRRYRQMAVVALTALVTTLVSLWLVGPNILETWREIQKSVAFFRTTYMLSFRGEEIGFDHSLFGIYKRFAHHLPPPEQLGHIANIYLAIAAVSGIALYFLKIRYLPLINQVLCLTIASILLPPISYEYTLMHLYIPWAMLVLFAQEQSSTGSQIRRAIRGLTAAFVCFAILLSPMGELIHHATRYGGQIKALVLVCLMVVGLQYPFASLEPEDTLPLAA
jgi:hypothetical protein